VSAGHSWRRRFVSLCSSVGHSPCRIPWFPIADTGPPVDRDAGQIAGNGVSQPIDDARRLRSRSRSLPTSTVSYRCKDARTLPNRTPACACGRLQHRPRPSPVARQHVRIGIRQVALTVTHLYLKSASNTCQTPVGIRCNLDSVRGSLETGICLIYRVTSLVGWHHWWDAREGDLVCLDCCGSGAHQM
jgi:hypothetical protein